MAKDKVSEGVVEATALVFAGGLLYTVWRLINGEAAPDKKGGIVIVKPPVKTVTFQPIGGEPYVVEYTGEGGYGAGGDWTQQTERETSLEEKYQESAGIVAPGTPEYRFNEAAQQTSGLADMYTGGSITGGGHYDPWSSEDAASSGLGYVAPVWVDVTPSPVTGFTGVPSPGLAIYQSGVFYQSPTLTDVRAAAGTKAGMEPR